MLTRVLLTLFLSATVAAAQPTTAPRKTVIVPSNFQMIVVDSRKAICQEGDEAWVRTALAEKAPATGPATRPADLLQKLTERRDVLADRMAADLALDDASEPRKLLDEHLIPMLRQAIEFDPPVFYLVTTQETLRAIVRGGWTDPTGRYHYNRAADRVSIDINMQVRFDSEMSDEVLAVLYQTSDSFAERRRKLSETIRDTEEKLAYALATRGQYATQVTFVNFINRFGIEPLNLREDQQWFGVGLAGVLSAQYLAYVNDAAADQILRIMSSDDPRNPVRSATIDLLSPMNLQDLREIAREAYKDAFRRRSTAVFKSWLDRAGATALPKVLRAMRANPPSDGAALLKIIRDQTGIDLTAEMKPK